MPHRERKREPARSAAETILWTWLIVVAVGCVVAAAVLLYLSYR